MVCSRTKGQFPSSINWVVDFEVIIFVMRMTWDHGAAQPSVEESKSANKTQN